MTATPQVDRDRIRELHARGLSCNAVARELGCAPSTVSRVGRAMGLTWRGSEQAKAAVERNVLDNRTRRAELIKRMYTRAEKILDRLDAERFSVVGFATGPEGGHAVVTKIPGNAVPGAEERALSGMVVNLLVAASRLEAVDAAHNNAGEARGILGELGEALQAAYGQLAHTNTPTARLDDEGPATEG